jgi:haloalkane dehalogenase
MNDSMPAGFMGRTVAVCGADMHYVEAGAGRPIVFLHGNPTSSFLWRHVLAALDPSTGRRIAVDLIGMGASGKPDIDYDLADHIDYVEALVDELALEDITFVAHDWGVAISLEYLRRHPDRVTGVAFMEGHVRPVPSWDHFDPGGREIFQALRSPGIGERMALQDNFLIETLLPAGMNRTLTDREHAAYRSPYPTPASRRPLLEWTRQIPIDGHPAHAALILSQAWEHFATSPVRKLLIHATPGAVIDATTRAWCQETVADLRVVDAGPASHFLPEDRPAEITRALQQWLELA